MQITPKAAMLGAGIAGAAVGAGGVLAIDLAARTDPTNGLHDAPVSVAVLAGFAGTMTTILHQRTVTGMVGTGLAGMAAGTVTAMALHAATSFNTVDPGLNALEQHDFSSTHSRRLAMLGGGGALVGAIAGTALHGTHPAGRAALIGAGVAGVAGALAATVMTTSGQLHVYRPATTATADVADALWAGAAHGADSLRVDPHVLDAEQSSDPGDTGRNTDDPHVARCYAQADADGDDNGMLTHAELTRYVASFDRDGDGQLTVDSGEWTALHEAVIAS